MLHKFAGLGSLLIRFRRWRWIVIGLIVLGVFIYEFTEHILFSGQPVREPDFLRDIIFYGLIAFLAGSYITNRLERLSIAYRQSSFAYDNQINLLKQLSDVQDPQEVSAIFLQSLRAIFLISGAQLLLYNSDEASFHPTASWSDHSARLPKLVPETGDANCSLNQANLTTKSNPLKPCICTKDLPDQSGFYHYCLPMKSDNGCLVGILYLHHTKELILTSEQQKLLNSLASEVVSTLERVQLRESLDQHQNSPVNIQQRIARDMHATLGHNLAYLRMKLAQIASENQLGDDPRLQDLIQLRDTANESYQQMRDLLVALTPEKTPNLRSMMTMYAQRVAKRAGFNLEIQYSGESKQLPAKTLQQVVLIVREALGNIEKHAKASHVEVRAEWGDGGLNIHITDDGCGFDPSRQLKHEQLGIRFMQERAGEMNGNLMVSSRINSGTKISLWVPYQQENMEN